MANFSRVPFNPDQNQPPYPNIPIACRINSGEHNLVHMPQPLMDMFRTEDSVTVDGLKVDERCLTCPLLEAGCNPYILTLAETPTDCPDATHYTTEIKTGKEVMADWTIPIASPVLPVVGYFMAHNHRVLK